MKTRGGQVTRVEPRSRDHLAREWDELAEYRENIIAAGRDLSYRHILLPSLLALSEGALVPGARVLDAGCGTGTFILEMAKAHPEAGFVAVDPSHVSIAIASGKSAEAGNAQFLEATVEEAVRRNGFSGSFSLVIANMLFQNVANLDEVLRACARAMTPDGLLIFAIPHPCFWPRYWQYDEEPWFRYEAELWINAPFRTSLSPKSPLTTTHTHRPLSAYMDAFSRADLYVESLFEPMPDAGIEGNYPIAWEFPRFLLGRCRPLPTRPDTAD